MEVPESVPKVTFIGATSAGGGGGVTEDSIVKVTVTPAVPASAEDGKTDEKSSAPAALVRASEASNPTGEMRIRANGERGVIMIHEMVGFTSPISKAADC